LIANRQTNIRLYLSFEWQVKEMKVMIVYGRGLDKNDKQLLRACKKLVGEVLLSRIMDLSVYVSENFSRFWCADRVISNVDLCFLRSFGPGSCEQTIKRVSMMEHFESSGILVVNPVAAFQKARNKYSTIFSLANAGIPVPPTYITEMSHWLYRASRSLKYSIYKPIVGSLGFGQMRFSDPDMAFNAYKTLEQLGQPLYLQEYLEKSGRDIRAFVIGEEIVASVYRIAIPEEWRTNLAQGGKAKPFRLSEEIQELAIKATKILGLVYAGVDILETKQGHMILEVNGSPSWQGLQNATGINIAEHLVQFAIELLKR
jgi:ribosomal protein S6--L-glutamate ligase